MTVKSFILVGQVTRPEKDPKNTVALFFSRYNIGDQRGNLVSADSKNNSSLKYLGYSLDLQRAGIVCGALHST